MQGLIEMKNVLITGCSRGLGSIVASDLQMRDCNVVSHFRSQCLVKNSKHVCGDINDNATLDAINEALRTHDINVFVNNAAVHQRKSFLQHTDDDITAIIATNLISQIKLVQRVYGWFVERNGGLIINVNSIAGIQPAPGEVVYAATKHGLKGFSQSLQVESLGTNIRITDIFPGAMKTDMTRERSNHDQLIDPTEVAKRICDIIVSENRTSLETEIVIRKFIQQ